MQNKTRSLMFAALFTALTAVGAFVRIPLSFYPVPLTLQTAFVFMAGLVLEQRAALLSQVSYVLLGLAGLPIFANGGGIHYMLDPTFGYLLSFILAAPMFSLLARHKKPAASPIFFWLGGVVIIFFMQVLGVAYMCFVSSLYMAKPIPFTQAIYLIFLFLPLDAIKFAVCMPVAKLLKKRFS